MLIEAYKSHEAVRSEAKSIAVVCVGRTWDWNGPHVLQTNMLIWTERMGALGFKVNFRRWQDEGYEEDALFISPGFNLPGGKYVKATKELINFSCANNKKLIFYACDVELLKAWSPYVARTDHPHGLVTNFRKPWQFWQAQSLFFDMQLWYDESRILKRKPVQPKYQVAYVGWPKHSRMTVLRDLGYDGLVMLGFGSDKQDRFTSALGDGNTPWPMIGELFELAAWHICISDNEHKRLWSSVSRPMEAWACGRPVLFHKSFTETAPKSVKWDLLKDFVFETASELHEKVQRRMGPDGIYDLDGLREDAEFQKKILTGTYYMAERPPFQWSERFLRGDFLSDKAIQQLGYTSPGTVSEFGYNAPGKLPRAGSGDLVDPGASPNAAG